MCAAKVTIGVESKFMQNFAVASAVNPGSGLTSIVNRSGNIEFFSIGTDGVVHNYYHDQGSDTGFSTVSLGLHATTISVVANAQGLITVFIANNKSLYMVTETTDPSQRWSAPVQLSYPEPSGAQMISAMFPKLVGNKLYIPLLITVKGVSPGASYTLVMGSSVGGGVPTFVLSRNTFSSLNCAWMQTPQSAVAFAVVDQVIVTIDPETLAATRQPMVGGFTSVSVTSSVDGDGVYQVYAALNDGNAYHLIYANQSYSWAQLTQAQNFRFIASVTNKLGKIHLLLVGANARLTHMPPSATSDTGFGPAAPIMADVGALAVAQNAQGVIEAFAASANGASLSYLFLQEDSGGNWQIQPVALEQSDNVATYASYGTDITVYNEVGSPLGETGVTIWASASTVLTINSGVYFVGPNRVARVTTNAAGMINLQQQINTLSTATILLTVPGVSAPGDTLTISQDAVTQAPLAALTGPELYDAKTAGGSYVMPDQYRTPDQAASVAKAVSESMQIGLGAVKRSVAADSIAVKRPRPGVAAVKQPAIEQLRALAEVPTLATPHWRLHEVDGKMVFEALPEEEAAAHVAALKSTTADARGFFDFLGSLGDLLSSVAQGIANIVETVVTTIVNGVKAVIKFIVDGVTYIFNTIVHTIEEAFNLVELVFAQIKVFFQTVFEWLGFIFNWNDITRTAKSLTYTTDQFLLFLAGAAGGIQSMVDDNIQALARQVDALFDEAIRQVGGGSSIGSYSNSNDPDDPEVNDALSNNPMYNLLLNNGKSMSLTRSDALMRSTTLSTVDWNAMSSQFNAFAASTTANPAFGPVDSFFDNLGANISNIFISLLVTLLQAVKALINAVLAGTQALADLLLQTVIALIDGVRDSLNAEWNIPILSPLFKWATNGMPLTTLNLIAMIFAVPGTILYKIVFNAAPFPDEASLTRFKNSFNAQSMLAASGLGKTPALLADAAAQANGGLLPKDMAAVVILLGCVAGYFNAGLTAVMDGIPGASNLAPLSISSFVCSVAGQVASFPWFYGGGSVGCSTQQDRANLLWTYGCIGILIDIFYMILEQKKVTVPDDVQSVVTHVYGDIHMILGVAASVGASGATIAANIIEPIPEMAKLLKLKAVVAATEGISLPVLAGIDAICMVIASTINCVEGINGLESA